MLDIIVIKIYNYFNKVPLWSVSLTGILCGGMATLFDLETLVQFMSIGTLTSYSFVAACVILLRYGAVDDSSLVQLSNSPFPVDIDKKLLLLLAYLITFNL